MNLFFKNQHHLHFHNLGFPHTTYTYSHLNLLFVDRNSPMNQNYYPVDFEAQYEETSEKMIEIASKNKDRIRSLKPSPLEVLEGQLDDLQMRIDDRDLQFRKQSIYSQYASGQLMAQRRKQPPEMCPQCGEELKKQAQCQFCAQIFCTKCCCRKRVIPFVSKDIRLCCEQCHWKFVKLFDNKAFYEEKQKLANVIHFVKNKVTKINEKIAAKSSEVEQFKKVKRDQRIKEKAVESKIQQQEKKLKQIEQELRRVVSEKAERMKQEQRRRQREQEEREKAKRAEQQRERLEQLERQMEQQRLKRQKQLQEQEHLTASQKKLQAQAQQRDLMEAFRKKEEQLKRREQQLLRKEQEMKKQLQAESKSVNSSTSINKEKTPKQSIGNTSSEKEKIVDTAESKSASRSRRQSDQINQESSQLPQPTKSVENLVRTQSTKSNAEQPVLKKLDSVQKQPKGKIEQQQPSDSLQRSLVNMFKPKRQDDVKSVVSNISRTSKSILDMSMNQILSVRIPIARTPSKIEQQDKSLPTLVPVIQQPRVAEEQRRSLVDRRSIKVEQVIEEVHAEEIRMNKDSILRNSSLISSNKNATINEEEPAPQKCACEIM